MSDNEWKVGDRVKCIEPYDDNEDTVDRCGTVIATSGEECAVQFDEEIEGGHTCSGNGVEGYCWWIGYYCLVPEGSVLVNESLLSFDDLMGG